MVLLIVQEYSLLEWQLAVEPAVEPVGGPLVFERIAAFAEHCAVVGINVVDFAVALVAALLDVQVY